MSLSSHHIEQLKALLGPKGWKEDAADLAPFLHEWRDRWAGETPLLALPQSTENCAELVRYCAGHRIAITVQGGNTGLVGAQTPQGEVLISTQRLSQVRDVNTANSTLTVEAGLTLAAAKDVVQKAGLLFPLSLASEGTASIGGVLSTNAGGMEVLRYGTARDLCLGLEVVTPKGEVLSTLKGLRKDNSGYDLKQLFIGAEGTLGIITAAVLKLYPIPPIRHTIWCTLNSVKNAIALLGFMRMHYGDALSKFELISQVGIDYVLKNIPGTRAPLPENSPWHVLLEFGFFQNATGENALENVMGAALNASIIQNAVIAQNETQAEAFLRLRESLSAAQKGEGVALKHDISVPVSAMAAFIEVTSKEAERMALECRIFAFGHVGDGNVHFNILQPTAMTREAFLALAPNITAMVYEQTMALGGSISAEHGIGIMKKEPLRTQKSAVEMDMMRTIKTALDPDNIMNPRVLF
ncbi:MAG: hydroxyacid dehydrogenase [Robiginitomaculum sp.]|nr:MAG: hydroxyacid dehydrogenase [Robiginitomaculum sp.]